MTDTDKAATIATLLQWAEQLARHGYNLAAWHNPRLMVLRLEQMAEAVHGGPLPHQPRRRPWPEHPLELNTWRDVSERSRNDVAIHRALTLAGVYGLDPEDIAPTLIVSLADLHDHARQQLLELVQQHDVIPPIVLTDGGRL